MCGVFLGIQRGAQYQANMAMLISAISELRGESETDAKDLEMLASRASVHARASVKNQLMISCLIIGLGLLGAMLRTPQEI